MDLRMEHPYAAGPREVFAMLTDPEFLHAKLAAPGCRDIEVVECTPRRIVTLRSVPLSVPGFLRKVISPANTVVQTDEWGPEDEDEGVWEGDWQVEAMGVPVVLSGTMRLAATGGGAVETIEGHARASVPLVGGVLERFVIGSTRDTLTREHALALEWLAAH